MKAREILTLMLSIVPPLTLVFSRVHIILQILLNQPHNPWKNTTTQRTLILQLLFINFLFGLHISYTRTCQCKIEKFFLSPIYIYIYIYILKVFARLRSHFAFGQLMTTIMGQPTVFCCPHQLNSRSLSKSSAWCTNELQPKIHKKLSSFQEWDVVVLELQNHVFGYKSKPFD